jgi:hypothetical protein
MKAPTNRAKDVDRPIVTSNAEEGHDSRVLPPLSISDGWPGKPGVRLRVQLVDPAPEPADSIEQVYVVGLTALTKDEPLAALEHFRSVVAQDPDGTYSTARLLALLLSAEIGDVASLRALLDSCLTNAQPDVFAQRAIEKSGLDFYRRVDLEDADIIVRECIDQAAVTAQVALAGCFLALGRPADAVSALVDGVTAWEARNTAWKIQVGRIADEVESVKRLPSGPAIRESLERALAHNWPEALDSRQPGVCRPCPLARRNIPWNP